MFTSDILFPHFFSSAFRLQTISFLSVPGTGFLVVSREVYYSSGTDRHLVLGWPLEIFPSKAQLVGVESIY